MTEPQQIRSLRFRHAREAEWTELDGIVQKALTRDLSKLTDDELERLPLLFRGAVSSLEVARKTTMDRALVAYLDSLCTRAYLAIYASRRAERGVMLRFFFTTFPRRVRALWRELSLATLLLSMGTALSYVLVRRDPSWYFAFVSPSLAGDRAPGATTETLRNALYAREVEGLDIFASFLFTHNAGIGLMAFALGFAAGVPTALLVFTNGLMLGAFLALYASHGLLVPLLGWLTPHGVPEFGAILLCAASGFHVAGALVRPSEFSTRDALVRAGRRTATVMTGCILLFAVAGLVEGIFRQVVVHDVARFALTALNLLTLGGWIILGGRDQTDEFDDAS